MVFNNWNSLILIFLYILIFFSRNRFSLCSFFSHPQSELLSNFPKICFLMILPSAVIIESNLNLKLSTFELKFTWRYQTSGFPAFVVSRCLLIGNVFGNFRINSGFSIEKLWSFQLFYLATERSCCTLNIAFQWACLFFLV